MDQNELEKFKRHCGGATELTLINEETGNIDKFLLKPLGASSLMEFMPIYQEFTKMRQGRNVEELSDKEKEDMFTNLPIDLFKQLSLMCIKTVKASYPDLSDDVIEGFVAKNFGQLSPIVLKINSYAPSKMEKK